MPSKHKVLWYLYQHRGQWCTAKEIAEEVGGHPNAILGTLQRLKLQGKTRNEKVPLSIGRYVYLWQITDNGAKFVEEVLEYCYDPETDTLIKDMFDEVIDLQGRKKRGFYEKYMI